MEKDHEKHGLALNGMEWKELAQMEWNKQHGGWITRKEWTNMTETGNPTEPLILLCKL